MKKRFLAVCLLMCFAAIFLSACGTEVSEKDKLVIYNSADYIFDTKLEEFKEYYKELTGREIDIVYVTFDTNETMLTKLLRGDSEVDVVCPSEYAIQKLLEYDMLLPLNYFSGDSSDYIDSSSLNGYVHNSQYVESKIVEKISDTFSQLTVNGKTVDMTEYVVPYMYGTLGILYNKQYFAELGIYDREVMNNANWGILFNDDGSGNILSDGLTGRIYMKDSIRDSYVATVCYLQQLGYLDDLYVTDKNSANYGACYAELSAGELINTVDDELLEICSTVLKVQKEQLYGYEVDFGKNELIQGIAYVDFAWSGDALYAVEESWDPDYIDPMEEYDEGESGGYTLGYYVPHTSGNIWFDGWVVPKTCKNVDAAKIFINYLNLPETAAKNMIEIGYTSAVSREAVLNDQTACGVLAEGYNVYAPKYRSDVLTISDFSSIEEFNSYIGEFDYATWTEFEEYFFNNFSPIDDSNWRYPFEFLGNNEYNRSIDDLGVMRDFGSNNDKVVTMWEEVRSTGITAWALLGWTALTVAVIVGVIALVLWALRRSKMRVIIKKS